MRGRALIIAANEFDDGRLRALRSPMTDARELKRVLEDPEIGGLTVGVVANKGEKEVREQIGEFFQEAKPEDLLVLHFSSHGLKDDSARLFFAARDTYTDRLAWTAISAEWVEEQIANSRSRRKVLLLDCCFSGAFAKGAHALAKAGDSVDVVERFQGGKGVAVLTASNSMEYAFDGDQLTGEGEPTSVFTTALVEGLETGAADLDGDGEISVDDLYRYVHKHVTERTSKQTPSISSFGLEGQLKIAMSVRSSPDKARLPTSMRDYSQLEQVFYLPLPGYQEGEASEVYALAVSPDGRSIAAGSNECVLAWKGETQIQKWNPDALPEPERVQEHGSYVYAVAFSPDGSMLAAAGQDGIPRVTDLTTGETRELTSDGEGHRDAVYGVDFSSDGTRLATGGWDRNVILWEPASGLFVRNIPTLGARISSVAFGRRSTADVLAVGTLDNRIVLIDASSGQEVAAVPPHASSVEDIAFSRNGDLLASCGLDKTVRVWHVGERRMLWSNDRGHEYIVRAIAFAPNGATLATAAWDKTIRLWDVARQDPRSPRATRGWAHTDWIWTIAFSPHDGAVFASGGSDGKIIVWAFPSPSEAES